MRISDCSSDVCSSDLIEAAKNAPIMYSEPCARLTKFMMPNTSVRPAAIRNSKIPNCRPFKDWMIKRPRLNEGSPEEAHFGIWRRAALRRPGSVRAGGQELDLGDSHGCNP